MTYGCVGWRTGCQAVLFNQTYPLFLYFQFIKFTFTPSSQALEHDIQSIQCTHYSTDYVSWD